MRDDSDLDFIVITKNENDVSSLAARVLGRKPPHDVAADILFYAEHRFLERARFGGVCFLAVREGCVVHGSMPTMTPRRCSAGQGIAKFLKNHK